IAPLLPRNREPEVGKLRLALAPFAIRLEAFFSALEPAEFFRFGERGVGVAARDGTDQHLLESRQADGMKLVIEERFPREGTPFGDDLLADHVRVIANLLLRVRVHAKPQEMQKIVQVHFPVRFGVRRKRKIFSRLFARNAELEPLLVDRTRKVLQLDLARAQHAPLDRVDRTAAALAIVRGLPAPLRLARTLRRIDGDGIASAE